MYTRVRNPISRELLAVCLMQNILCLVPLSWRAVRCEGQCFGKKHGTAATYGSRGATSLRQGERPRQLKDQLALLSALATCRFLPLAALERRMVFSTESVCNLFHHDMLLVTFCCLHHLSAHPLERCENRDGTSSQFVVIHSSADSTAQTQTVQLYVIMMHAR